MSLAVGASLGHYTITELIGRGGMGSVYRALDTRLNRPVAIKILSSDVADATARRRFQQEAQMASSLNHPHILTVHDAGEIEGRQYLVAEFVDGGTLRDWYQTASRTPKQAIELLVGVADALACAHDAGILHRDVKPENILIAKSGYAKLADFGLAKLAEREHEITRTLADTDTRAGAIVGTLAYMSPEQAAGGVVDARSDIFSFGVVLYETVTGRRLFGGPNLDSSASNPPLALVSPMLRLVVEKALEHDPAERYQSMREVVVDLRRFLRGAGAALAPTPARPRRRGAWLGWGIAAALLGVLGWREAVRPPAADANPLANARFSRLTDFNGHEMDASISPDGKFVAFVSDHDGPFDIWLSQVGTGRLLNLTHGSVAPLPTPYRTLGFTGDGSDIWLAGGGYAGVRLRLMPLTGGAVRNFLGEKVADPAWSPDGKRIAYHSFEDGDPLFVADPDGANARRIMSDAAGIHNHFPTWSPDGKWLYFVHGAPAAKETDIWRISLTRGERERLTQENTEVAFPTPIGSETLLYISRDPDGSGPWLKSLDIESKRSRRIAFGTEQYTSLGASSDGTKLVATVSRPQASLWSVPILDRPAAESEVKAFPLPTVRALGPRFGGGSLFYLSSRGAADGLWRFEKGEAAEIWRGSEGGLMDSPAVSPDGRRVAIVLRRQGKRRLHTLSADGAELQPIAEPIDIQGAPSWSPDGRWLAAGGRDAHGPGLFKLPVDGGSPVRLASGELLNPVWSPDGSAIVYAGTNVSGFAPLAAVRPDGTALEIPPIDVQRDGDRFRFFPTGNTLIYVQGLPPHQDFWRVDLGSKRVRRLTELNNPAGSRSFDVTPDGKQIVFDRLRDNSDVVFIDIPKR